MGNINYSESHMNSIAEKYFTCVRALGEITASFAFAQGIKHNVQEGYKGMGAEPAAEALQKLAEHISLLSKCCSHTRAYVLDALETMQDADKTG